MLKEQSTVSGISVVIPTHNRIVQLKRVIESLRIQNVSDSVNVEVVVVANGCTDETESEIKGLIAGFPFDLRCVDESQLGLNSARNRAVQEAKNEIVVFLDDDVLLSQGYLEGLCEVYSEHDADIVGGRTELWWETVDRPEWFPDKLLHLLSCKDFGDSVCELHTGNDLIGANFSFRKRVYEKIGPFKLGLDRTGNLLLGGGETEFLNRAFKAGFKAFYSPKSHLKHWVAPGRPKLKYLKGVAQGTAMSYIFARESFSPWQIFKWSVFHVGQWTKHLTCEVMARAKSNQQSVVFHQVKRAGQLGFLSGIFYRMVGRSTLK